jgi:hypothetical protein
MTQPLYQFVIGDYFATGEGRTIMLMITRAYPAQDDYETPGSFAMQEDGKLHYTPGVLKSTTEQIALREFTDEFGAWFGASGKIISEADFLKQGSKLIPEAVREIIGDANAPGNFKWASRFHCNYS